MATRKLNSKGLTLQQAAFVKEYTKQILKDGRANGSEAIKKSYPNTITLKPKQRSSMASELLNKPQVRDSILSSLESKCLTDDYLAENIKTVIDEGVHIKPTVFSALKGMEMLILLKHKLGKPGSVTNNFFGPTDIDISNPKEMLEKRKDINTFFSQFDPDDVEEGEIVTK